MLLYGKVLTFFLAAIPKPKDTEAEQAEDDSKPQLPQTLVRIPIEQAEDAKKAMQDSQSGD